MATVTAAQLIPLVNGYTLSTHGPRTVTLPNAQALAALSLQEITVTGILHKHHIISFTDKNTGARTARLKKPKSHNDPDGTYEREDNDHDVHFCLGAGQIEDVSESHVACELQNVSPTQLIFFNSHI